jgi:hypothetical protein
MGDAEQRWNAHGAGELFDAARRSLLVSDPV